MSARDLLLEVADVLRAVHLDVKLQGDQGDKRCLYVGHALVAWVSKSTLFVGAAQVFNGHHHVVPDGLGQCEVTPGSRHAKPVRLARLIEQRIEARAKSLPVPVDAPAIVRDP